MPFCLLQLGRTQLDKSVHVQENTIRQHNRLRSMPAFRIPFNATTHIKSVATRSDSVQQYIHMATCVSQFAWPCVASRNTTTWTCANAYTIMRTCLLVVCRDSRDPSTRLRRRHTSYKTLQTTVLPLAAQKRKGLKQHPHSLLRLILNGADAGTSVALATGFAVVELALPFATGFATCYPGLRNLTSSPALLPWNCNRGVVNFVTQFL